ncbi:urease accessory UreF family protein [Paucibacter sp. APW11]|uniref:Urease accessory protein UreF n=1 Tax=Roseateles aquae TaxID=3077235 RepID=A0ABU3PFY9_9BURK|nr:urease accessory UreF family protein [Paucibacter sp. APW11]MDT9001448.1 urease accessory UreF family protein [Paucibacter sp. APW11]
MSRAALLQLIWLASPALPIGGFSYSEGLEAAVDHGLVHDADSAADWLSQQLLLSQARGDLAVAAQALPAWRALASNADDADDANAAARLQALNDWVLQTRETAELRLQCEQMGRSLLDWLGKHDTPSARQLALARSWPTPSYPLLMALGLAASAAAREDALLAYAFGWAENMVQAAIKAVPLGQSAGQRVLARLAAEIPAAVTHALSLLDDERQAFAPMLAILSARHEQQYSRLFRS